MKTRQKIVSYLQETLSGILGRSQQRLMYATADKYPGFNKLGNHAMQGSPEEMNGVGKFMRRITGLGGTPAIQSEKRSVFVNKINRFIELFSITSLKKTRMKLLDKLKWAYGVNTSLIQTIFRILLGGALLFAGISHLTFNRLEFVAQVPNWVPLSTDLVVVLSGIVEIALGLSLLVLNKWKALVGFVTAVFFVLIFPGNISQYVNRVDAFGLDTDQARLIRLFFQPVLVLWAIWSTGALKAFSSRNA